MIILPIGHEESEVRRLPWVTFGIMLLCLAVLVGADGTPRAAPPLPESVVAAADYWRAHPYLEADAGLVALALSDLPTQQRATYREWLVESAGHVPRYQREAEQRQLDRLVAIGRAAVRESRARAARSLYERYGFTPADPSPGALLSHAFVHAGWLHLLSNLFIFFLAGPPIEDRWGRPLFAFFFGVSAVASALVHAAMTVQPGLPLVGASGAIAGVMGACLVRYWKASIRFAYLFLFGMRGTFWAPAWLMLPLWFASEVAMALLTDDLGGGGVAYWAHVGGFAVGVAFALVIRQRRIEERYIHPAIESKITLSCHPVIEEALEARAGGDEERAYALLARAAREHGDDPDLVAAFWDVAVALGRRGAAARALVALVTRRALSGDTELAARLWCEGLDGGLEARPGPAPLLALMPALRSLGRGDRARQALSQALEARDLAPAEALRAVEEARELGRETTLAAARRALELRLDAVRRDRMKQLVAELSGEAPDPAATAARAVQGLTRFSGVKLAEAVPTALEPDALWLELAGGRRVRLAYTRIDAVAVAAVSGMASRPVLVLDLLANWGSLDEELLRVVRLRSDSFDPREVVEGQPSAVAAFRELVARLLAATGGQPLPDRQAALGRPFRPFPDLEAYQRSVLQAG